MWQLGCFCLEDLDKTAIGPGLDKTAIGPALGDKLARGNMELAIRGSNLECFCLDKTAKALIKRPLDTALIKRPLDTALIKRPQDMVLIRRLLDRLLLGPRLLWLAPQSDHGSAARAETEAFFNHGPPQSDCGGGKLTLFSKAQSDRINAARAGCFVRARGKLAHRLMTGRSLRNPITGAPHARKLKLFSTAV